jgi:hypothetical protein
MILNAKAMILIMAFFIAYFLLSKPAYLKDVLYGVIAGDPLTTM